MVERANVRRGRESTLPILGKVAPRVREPTPAGSVGEAARTAQPAYVPPPLAARPFAADIGAWLDRLRTEPFLQLVAAADAVRR
ncbi:MAG: hypothetical protein PVH00_14090, partial [Gemmatimonadota bacterium]